METWSNKQVFEKLGEALFEAQSLEAVLVNLFAGVAHECHEVDWRPGLQALLDDRESNQILKKLESLFLQLDLPPYLMPVLHQALIDRNWLLHHFYFDFGRSLFGGSGAEQAVNILEEKMAFVAQLVVNLNELLIDRQLNEDSTHDVINNRLVRTVDAYLGRREFL
ncbi:hypothetical protein [Alkalimarinus coralli]|uniref:hypothetical protein n=1 Tax=Alkalimarinus coralli TaxID=2935863 RepID=UPI00202B5927|nr:hypothetical protein [Alkalimarinus coralli]